MILSPNVPNFSLPFLAVLASGSFTIHCSQYWPTCFSSFSSLAAPLVFFGVFLTFPASPLFPCHITVSFTTLYHLCFSPLHLPAPSLSSSYILSFGASFFSSSTTNSFDFSSMQLAHTNTMLCLDMKNGTIYTLAWNNNIHLNEEKFKLLRCSPNTLVFTKLHTKGGQKIPPKPDVKSAFESSYIKMPPSRTTSL